MANKYIVTEKAYRNQRLYEAGEEFFCENDDIKNHCDSRALKPADKETEDAILEHAPESVKAKAILAAREKAKKEADAEAKAKKEAEAKKPSAPPAK